MNGQLVFVVHKDKHLGNYISDSIHDRHILNNICDLYAHNHDIIFNPSKTTCIHFLCHQSSFPGKKILFMGTAIKFVSEITFLGISIKNNDVTDHNISKTFRIFYHKTNQVMNDFKYLHRNIKFQLLSSYCLDVYESQLCFFL